MKDNLLVDILYQSDFLIPYLKQFKRYLSIKPRVLDLGCKMGYNTKKIQDLGCEVVGIDINKENIIVAKEKNNNIAFYEEDALNNLDYLGEFDGIVAIGSLIYYDAKDLQIIFNNLYRILKSNGYILLVNRNKKEDKIAYNNLDNIVYSHQREILEFEMNNKFQFIEELAGDDNWNFLVYKKNTIK